MLHLLWLTSPSAPSSAATTRTTQRRIVVSPHSVLWLLHACFVLALFLLCSSYSTTTTTVNGLAFVVAPKTRKSMIVIGCGMTKQQSFWQSQRQKHQHTRSSSSSSSFSTFSMSTTLVMRDKSASYWFQAGDTVRVVENVYMNQKQSNNNRVNLLGRVGTVLQTWEKCDVDPTCCCAEQVNPEMAVHVQFVSENGDSVGRNEEDFTYYFSEEELVHHKEEVQEEDTQTTTTSAAPPHANVVAPFDGMSCVAFKLEELQKMGQKPRGIASFDPQKEQNRSDNGT